MKRIWLYWFLIVLLFLDRFSHPVRVYGSVQANENGPILDREISRDFINNA